VAEPAEEAKEEEDEEEDDAEAVLVPEGELSANVSVYILCVHSAALALLHHCLPPRSLHTTLFIHATLFSRWIRSLA
jgi:hypothetical protein